MMLPARAGGIVTGLLAGRASKHVQVERRQRYLDHAVRRFGIGERDVEEIISVQVHFCEKKGGRSTGLPAPTDDVRAIGGNAKAPAERDLFRSPVLPYQGCDTGGPRLGSAAVSAPTIDQRTAVLLPDDDIVEDRARRCIRGRLVVIE